MCEAERITAYREVVRLHMHLSDEAAAYQNEIQALIVVVLATLDIRSKTRK
jgi:hypothetical protein